MLGISHKREGIQLAIQGTDLIDATVLRGWIKCRTEKSFIRWMSDDFNLATPMIREGRGSDTLRDCLSNFSFSKVRSENIVMFGGNGSTLRIENRRQRERPADQESQELREPYDHNFHGGAGPHFPWGACLVWFQESVLRSALF